MNKQLPGRDQDVFILGAGFSVPCGFPAGNRLFTNIKKRSPSVWEGRILPELSFRHYDCFADNFYYEDFLSDVDSDIDFFESLKTVQGSFAERRYDELLRMRHFIHAEMLNQLIGCDREFQKKATTYAHIKHLSDYVMSNNGHIITFNYDLCIERQVQWNKINIKYSLIEDVKSPFIFLHKLHGSLNWYKKWPDYLDRTELVSLDEINVAKNFSANLQAIDTQLKDDSFYNLIYPSVFKTISGCKFLNRCWSDAMVALTFARNIYFLGYSMPEGDRLARALLQASFRPESGEQQGVVVLDKTFENMECQRSLHLKERYNRIFGETVQYRRCDFCDGLEGIVDEV